MKIFGKTINRDQILRHVGRMDQIGGARPCALSDGPARGMRAIDVDTGAGLSFTVLPDRGLDISRAVFNGASLCWRAPVGDVHPSYFEAQGCDWQRTFGGGLLVTCGLTYHGAPCVDGDEELGLHGRYSTLPATGVCCHQDWQEDEYLISIEGTVREAHLNGPNLALTRQITTRLGSQTISVRDTVTNEGYHDSPLMILYHCNLGFPLLDKNTRLYSPSRRVCLRETKEEVPLDRYSKYFTSLKASQEEVFFHEMEAGADGYVSLILANHDYAGGRGLGVLQRYHARNLPLFTQWKSGAEGACIMGLEPSNAPVEGRAKARAEGLLETLEPGGAREYHVELTVLADNAEISQAREAHVI
jgi:hypothetical protein